MEDQAKHSSSTQLILVEGDPVAQQVRAITRAIHAEVVAAKTVHESTHMHTMVLRQQLEQLESKAAEDEIAIQAEERKAERERVRQVQKHVKPSPAVQRALTRGSAPTMGLPQSLALAARVYSGLASNTPDGKIDLGDSKDSKVVYRRRGEAAVDCLAFDNVGWFYRDLEGVAFGPFRSSQMRGWLAQGYFHLDIPIRLGMEGQYYPLKEWFPIVADAFPDSAQDILSPLRTLLAQHLKVIGGDEDSAKKPPML